MKLWDLPLAHIPPNPGRYKTRRSGWMHLDGGRSFCMEAVYTKDEPGAGKSSFCSVDLLQGVGSKLCSETIFERAEKDQLSHCTIALAICPVTYTCFAWRPTVPRTGHGQASQRCDEIAKQGR